MVESLHQKASSSLSGTSSLSMFVKLQPLPNGVFPYMEKDTSGKDAVCEALCHQEASLPLRTEAATGGSRASDVAKFHCRVCEAGYDGQPGSRVLSPQPQMRAHIATHILRGHIRMGPAGICGYCGEKDNPCVVSLKNGQSSKIRNARNFAKAVTDGIRSSTLTLGPSMSALAHATTTSTSSLPRMQMQIKTAAMSQ